MKEKNENPYKYRVTSVGVYFVLQGLDGDEFVESRDLEDIASGIFEDSEILMAYEENLIDMSDVENCIEDIRDLIANLRFEDNFESNED
jgi:hypothetical protein